MTSPARRLALSVLNRVGQERGTLADALAADEIERMEVRERAFLHELVLGTIRRRGWLDHALEALSERPLKKTSPPIRNVLRLGAQQILFLRVPAHAAVAESVTLARSAEPRAAGFVNAVLRRLEREGPPPEPDPVTDPMAWLITVGSLPRWLARRWLSRLGAGAAVARARALLDTPPTAFRFNPRVSGAAERAADAGLAWRETGVPGALEVTAGRPGPLARDGVLYVQDAGSQLVARLALTSGRILDACAAPGGKALLLADGLAGSGGVIATEVAPRRLRTLARLRDRWGAVNLVAVGADARRPPFRGRFDSILVDAPCSGLGTLARHPDIRWRSGPEEPARHARRQREILGALAPLVRPGGRLVYSTCSVEDEENEGVVDPFLGEHPDFQPADLPPWAVPFGSGRFVRMEPAIHPGDAFFGASLVRVG